jgi:hypothetical protein
MIPERNPVQTVICHGNAKGSTRYHSEIGALRLGTSNTKGSFYDPQFALNNSSKNNMHDKGKRQIHLSASKVSTS